MKQIVAGSILSFLVLSTLFITNQTIAQTQTRYDTVKERIRKELNIDEAKADSTATILKRYFTTVKKIRENEGMSDENKQLAIKKEKRQEIAQLKTFLSTDQLKKLRELVQQYKDMRQQNKPETADTSLSKYYF
jgi:ribosome-binding protein aMBF1 (putative translation factor)